MFILGTKIKRKLLGRVADFCPICRKYRAHTLTRVSEVNHIYCVSLGKGSLLDLETKCEVCHFRGPADLQEDEYKAVSQNTVGGVEELIDETNPDLDKTYAPRIALERRIAAGNLGKEERIDELRRPFFLLDPLVEENRRDPEWSPGGQIALKIMLGMLVVFLIMGFANVDVEPEAHDWVLGSFALAFVLSLGVTFYFFLVRSLWFMKHRLRRQLMRALAPLQPTIDELVDTLDFCRREGLRIGKTIKAPKLYGLLQEARMLAPLHTSEAS
ncbi:MAG: hypothetical protein V3T86_17305 [Planctomycetota bacterium]